MIETTLSYLRPMSERPYYYNTKPPPDTPWRNTKGDFRRVSVHDARDLPNAPGLDREGFALARVETRASDLYDAAAVRAVFYPEVCEVVRRATGARRVLAFDHNVRNADRAALGEDGAQGPVKLVHNDYTEASGPQRVRDLLPDEADALLTRRFAVINVWKPIRGPVEQSPLGFCDAGSIAPEDMLPTDLIYADRSGEIYSFLWRETHRWFYYPAMRDDEALLLKCYDSRRDCARFTAHSAFDDPGSPEDAAVRESIEVRTLAFW
ncbi:MAG: CmcJ/NvfI family oxidoreductase [Myxococcota bacterium]